MGRPRLYKNDAERQAAHRERNTVVDARFSAATLATLDELAKQFDVPRTEVINSLVTFALLNRNWHTLGLFGKRLPSIVGKKT